MTKPIVVTGFPYAFPYYFKVFEYLKNKDDFVFILPKLWLAKKGKVRVELQPRPDLEIHGLRAVSYGGHGIKGLLKGWLPGLIFLLPYLKVKYGSRVLYSCSEPNLLTTLYNGIIAKCCGFKHILFTWQNVPPEQRLHGLKLKLANALTRLNLRLSDGVICGNQKAEKIVKKLQTTPYHRPRRATRQANYKLQTIVCPIAGVDTEKFKPDIKIPPVGGWREKLGVRSDEKLILFYGALDKRKGLNVLIEAFNLLNVQRSTLNAKLVIVGTGPEEKNLKSQISNLKINEKVIFIDWMPNDQLPALLNAADVFVYPSVPFGGWEEQFGYAMTEAGACGVPVVATRTGSIEEVVAHSESGILVEPNNPEELAEAITKILSDDNLAKQMGGFGREYVVKNFGHTVVAKKIEDFLLSFL